MSFKKIIVLLLFLYAFSTALGQTKIDSLKKLLKTAKEDTSKVNYLNGIGYRLIFKGENDSAIDFLTRGKTLAQKLSWKKGEGTSYLRIGIVYFYKGSYDTALAHFSKAIALFEQIGEIVGLTNTLNNMAIIYNEQTQYTKALEVHLKVYKLREGLKNKINLAGTAISIGNIYNELKMYTKALEYYNKALQLGKEEKDSVTIGAGYYQIGYLHEKKKNYDTALVNLEKATKLFGEQGNLQYRSVVYKCLGDVYKGKENYEKAIEYYQRAMDISVKLQDIATQARIYHGLATASEKLHDYKRSLEYFNTGLKLVHEIGNKEGLSLYYSGISTTYLGMKDYKNAYDYHVLYSHLNDSLFNATTSGQISEMEAKYQNEKKQKEIELLQKENEIKELAVSQGRTKVIALTASLVALLVLGILFYQRSKIKHRQALAEEKEKYREMQLKAVLQTQEEERKRISKDLHDGVGQLLSALKLKWQNLQQEISATNPQLKEKANSLSEVMDEAASEVRSISHQMMPRMLTESGLVPAIEGMLGKSLRDSGIHYEFEHLNLEGRFGEEIEISMYRIAQELVNNVIKHSSATLLNVQLYKNANNLVMIVEDNGKGFDYSSKSNGHGLLNIQTRAEAIHGEVNYEAGPKCGTISTVRLTLV